MKSVCILGVNGYPGVKCHDGSAAILKDGLVLAAAEQERFSRRKHAIAEAPYDAIKFCLQKTGLSLNNISYIATGWSENEKIQIIQRGRKSEYSDAVFPKNIFSYTALPPIYFVKHHIAHIMSSYYQSGFFDAACLVVDGRGEFESITLAEMRRDKLRLIRQYDISCSLGAFYGAAAKYCGLEFEDAGKLMGLAPYGLSNQAMPLSFDTKSKEFSHAFKIQKKAEIDLEELEQQYLNYFEKNNYPYKVGDKSDIVSYIHFAASAQGTVENVILDLVRILKKSVDSDNLIISGGVGLNCTTNGIIDRSGLYKNIFIHPGTNDAGISIGAPLEVFRHLETFKHSTPKQITNVYLGNSYTNEEIENIIKSRLIDATKLNRQALITKTASLLAQGGVIAWFQNGFEFGPRALGARSFLASPVNRKTLNKLNNLKGREIWRPLSPIILDTQYSSIFDDKSPQNLSRFMLKTCFIKQSWQSKIPALTHIDGTSRPQRLLRKDNALLYDMISLYNKKTGVPIIVNTSLNVKGQPIVNTPAEAVAILETQIEIDALVIGNWFVKRK